MSYAQRLEDTHLARVFAGEPPGFYIDVGGGHPVADNVTYLFYLSGWRGIVVEPQRHLAGLYEHMRPRDVVIDDLVGAEPGEATFHSVEHFHGFSTTVAAHAATARELGASVTTETRPVTTLAALCAVHAAERIDLLKIDVEGAEGPVLAGNDWTRFRPRVVVVEAMAPGTMLPAWEGWEHGLVRQGYRFVFFDKLNRFYVAEEAAPLAARFPPAPLAWDSVAHLWDFGRAPDRPDHPDHALAKALLHGFFASAPALDRNLLRQLMTRGTERLSAEGQAVKPPNLDEDALTAALARIASMYDGGHLPG
jgi:FkbM family methyltransferase